jgi:hypothetical protein
LHSRTKKKNIVKDFRLAPDMNKRMNRWPKRLHMVDESIEKLKHKLGKCEDFDMPLWI